MMVELAPLSAESSAVVRTTYREHLGLLVLDELASLESALATGGLVPLPLEPERFNLKPRTEGPAPIAEKDLANQSRYLSARPATLGALLEIAARVRSGPLEITSLVRHREYQEALRATNRNATTAVPMHTMGLAVDIALINSPLETAYEIRDVLRQMQAAGDILFIGERQQLVFHVVPHPSRLGHFADVYARLVAGHPTAPGALPSEARPDGLDPTVETQVIALRPTDEHAAEWWQATDVSADVAIEVSAADAGTGLAGERPWSLGRLAGACMTLVTLVLRTARQLAA